MPDIKTCAPRDTAPELIDRLGPSRSYHADLARKLSLPPNVAAEAKWTPYGVAYNDMAELRPEAFLALSFDGRVPRDTVTFHEGFKADGPVARAGGD